MTRDGTVGRSDATERSLPLHWDIDPARVMRPRFADSIRASSPSGLREQACKRLLSGTLHFLLQGGGHPHMKRREFTALLIGGPSFFGRPLAALSAARRDRRLSPEVFKSIRRKFGVTHRVLDVLVAEPSL